MKNILTGLIIATFFIVGYITQVSAAPVVMPITTGKMTSPPTPPAQNCYIQEKMDDTHWRCYAKSEWDEKENAIALKKKKEIEEDKKFWNSEKGKSLKIFNWVFFIISILLGIIYSLRNAWNLDEAFFFMFMSGFFTFIIWLISYSIFF